jgi:methionyl-tRNA formyltransferase
MNILFFGTPDFAAVILKALSGSPEHRILATVTQPDRPKGRGKLLAVSPVKALAAELSIPVLQPETLRGVEIRRTLRKFGADVFVVAAYGLKLPEKILAIPPHGCLNVHASLLPKYRGASPIHHALLNGENRTGITIIRMDKGIDTGDMLLEKDLIIGEDERFPSLHDRLAELGGTCILEALALIGNEQAAYTTQDHAASSYAPVIAKEDGQIDWSQPTRCIMNRVRAFDPWPGAHTFLNGALWKIWGCEAEADGGNGTGDTGRTSGFDEPLLRSAADEAASPPANDSKKVSYSAKPGTVTRVDLKRGLRVKTGDGALWLIETQAAGGKRMMMAEYLRGHPVAEGEVFGTREV